MLTGKDIVTKYVAEVGDPRSTHAGEFAQGKPARIGADDSVEQAIKTMIEYKVRRLPVIEGYHPIGIMSQADIATSADEDSAGAWSTSSRPLP
jgi:CBS domain-containing protein